MKKTILLLLLIVSLSSLQAQESTESVSPGKIFIGIKAGYGIVNYESKITDEKDFAKMTFDNFSFGLLTGYKFSGLISLQLEGNFSQYGAHHIIPTYLFSPYSPLLANYGPVSTVDHVDMDLYSIDVPLTVKVSLKEGTFSPYVYCGVNYGINIIGRASIVRRIANGEDVDYRTATDDITARLIQNEFAPIIGCGIKTDMLKISLFGDVRYKYGITNLSNIDNFLGFTNSALWVSAGFFIYL